MILEYANMNRRATASEYAPIGLIRGSMNVVAAIGTGREMAEDVLTKKLRMHSFIDYPLAVGDLGDAATKNMATYFPTMSDVHNMVLDCVCGLEFLHTKARITHNDIKCGNVLIFRERGRHVCKLSDLGICTPIREKDGYYKPPLATRGWMAPELYTINHGVKLAYKKDESDQTDQTVNPNKPPKIDYNEAGKLDMFSMGLALMYVVDGTILFQLPNRADVAMEDYVKGRGDPESAEKLWRAAIKLVKPYYEHTFITPMPVGKYVRGNISRGVCTAISLMCMVDPALRISAKECVEMITKDTPFVMPQPSTNTTTATQEQEPDIKPDIVNVIDLANTMASVSAVSVAISPMSVSNSIIQQSNSVVRPKRKANIPPKGFGSKRKHVPTPTDAIVISDMSSPLPNIDDTPQPKKAKHVAAANVNAANAYVLVQVQPTPSCRELISRLVVFMYTKSLGRVQYAQLKDACPHEFHAVMDELYADENQKSGPINDAGVELYKVLTADKMYMNFARQFFKLLTNRGDGGYDRLKDKYGVAYKKN